MEWLSQNWIWLVGIGAILMMYRGARAGHGGCCGGGVHGGDDPHLGSPESSPTDVVDGGIGHGH
jgi:hypothetical protein